MNNNKMFRFSLKGKKNNYKNLIKMKNNKKAKKTLSKTKQINKKTIKRISLRTNS